MHYGEVEKWGETLTNYFSSDFHHEFVKFCTKLSEKMLLKKWDKTTTKAVGGVFSNQDWSQKNLSPKELLFSYASSSRLYPCE